tara:strand:- start:150 stop:974 length:825 start_codon:yes stop_codon:yes gene_type:complete
MSIVCLKNKTKHYPRIAPISGKGENGFSLNGGYRNIGSVGQFRLIGNTTRTPFKGNTPKGNGGNGGQYFTFNTATGGLNSGSCMTNDNKIIKKSSLNNSGMLDTKYKWTKAKYPYYWVQDDDSNPENSSQSIYIQKIKQSSGKCNFINIQSPGNTLKTHPDNKQVCSGQKCFHFIGTKKYMRTPYAKNFNQPAMSQSQYLQTGGLYKKKCLPTPPNKQPFPMTLNHSTSLKGSRIGIGGRSASTLGVANGCATNFSTWQQAQQAGLLPPDWTPG